MAFKLKSARATQWLLVVFVSLGSITYGYCSSIIATTLGQPSFLSYFLLDSVSNASQLEGAINGVFQAGGLIGCLSVCETADRFGRRMALLIGGVFGFIGGALQSGSVHIAMFIVARLLTGIGIGMLVALVPIYQSEIAPTKIRGLLVGMHGIMICIGYTLASWLGLAFYFVNANGAQWRLPLAIQAIPPLGLVLGVLFIPETPRYLISQDKISEAWDSFRSVRDERDGDTEASMQQEFNLLHAQILHEEKEAVSFMDLLTHPNLRRRCIIGFLTLFAAQGTGTLVINNYGPFLYKSLGFGTVQQLLIQCGYITICPFGNLFNSLVVDKVGRIPMLMIGCAGTVSALVGECVTVSRFNETGDRGTAAAAVFFLFLHIVFFSGTIDATTYIYSTEIFPTPVRAKGMGVSVSGLFVATIIFLQAAPTAFDAIGWKYYIVFALITFIMVFVAWKLFPETKGKTLEDIAEVFGDTVEHHTLDEKITGKNDMTADVSHISVAQQIEVRKK